MSIQTSAFLEANMTLRCKDGDLAVIVHDTPECSQGAV